MKKLLLLSGLIMVFGLLAQAQSSQRVSAKLFYSLSQKHPEALILDVRPMAKYQQYRLDRSILAATKEDLKRVVKKVDRSDTIFVYCEKELRSGPAVEILDSLGYTNVYELKGGLISWRRNALPLDDKPLLGK